MDNNLEHRFHAFRRRLVRRATAPTAFSRRRCVCRPNASRRVASRRVVFSERITRRRARASRSRAPVDARDDMGCISSKSSSARADKISSAYGDTVHFEASGRIFDFNARLTDEFEIVDRVGFGQQGTVYRVREIATGDLYAMKETHIGVFGANAKRREAYCEIETLAKMRHPNVVSLKKAFQTSSEVQVVMELAGDETLLSFLVKLDEDEGLSEAEKVDVKHELLRQLVDAVAHVHSRDCVFRDLKHDNVMVKHDGDLKKAQIKLIDFGRAALLRREDRFSNLPPLGTSLFQAPEVEQRKEYGQASDMWAVGVFAYFLTTGVMPFEHTVSGLYKALRGEYEPMDVSVDKNARDLVSKLLVLNPSKRINAAQAATHRYLRKGYEAHRHVAQGDSLQVPSDMVSSAKKQLRALVMQESLERHTVSLLADKLNPEDVTTLRRWLGMKAEKSVHRGTANVRIKHQIQMVQSESRSPSAATPDDTVSGGHAYIDDIQAQRALDAMYKDYAERGSDSKDTSFHGRGLSQSASFAALSDALNNLAQEEDKEAHSPPSKSSPPAKPPRLTMSDKLSRSSPGLSGRLSQPGSSKNLSGRSFVGIAHASGFCTIDELITACLSARLTIVAEELEKVRSSLKMERMEKLKSVGIDSQDESILLDIILFRHDDLLSRVEAIHMRQLKDWSVRGGTRSIVFDGSAQYVKPIQEVEDA